jgi:hypothetical protein
MTTRPYPNVRPSRFKVGRWEALRPSNGKHTHVGTFDSPEAARRAVLIAQAEHLEAKAAAYRAEAERVIGPPMTNKHPKVWKATDLAPARPPRAGTDPQFRALALTVHCPVCPANPGQLCVTRLPGGYHIARADKAVRRSSRLSPPGISSTTNRKEPTP